MKYRLTRWILVLAPLAATACGDDTATDGPSTVAASGAGTGGQGTGGVGGAAQGGGGAGGQGGSDIVPIPVEKMSVGPELTCEVRVDGSLWCWGDDYPNVFREPTRLGVDVDWKSVAVGWAGACALKTDGSLWCWSDLPVGADTFAPERKGETSQWLSVVVGDAGWYALRDDGTLWRGVIFLPDPEVPIGTLTDWRVVNTAGFSSFSGAFVYGIRSDGSLWRWLDGEEPAPSHEGTWLSLSVGGAHACGIQLDGTLWCWGDDYHGQLGQGDYGGQSSETPLQVEGNADWTWISAGAGHTCGVRADSTLWCWGSAYTGELGKPGASNDDPHGSPMQIGGNQSWTRVVASSGRPPYEETATPRTCAYDDAMALWCWGSNRFTGLGLGHVYRTSEEDLVGVGDDAGWTAIDAGAASTCGIRGAGELWCWGWFEGQEPLEPEPRKVGGAANWTKIMVGDNNFCGFRGPTSLYCWGLIYGNQPTPGLVSNDAWIAADPGFDSACAVRADTTLWCWGFHFFGDLGIGGEASNVPVQVGADTGWKTVSTIGSSSCALRDNGTLWCWGGAGNGVPAQVGADTDWKAIDIGELGGDTACGLKTDGALWCWGGFVSSPVPVPVGVDTDWETVEVGDYVVCGKKTDGTRWCFGSDYLGQVGNGPLGSTDDPTAIGPAGEWSSLSQGHHHGCGVKADGTAWCWGDGSQSQLGQPTRYDVPTLIRP